MADDAPQFARSGQSPTVELRGECPREIVAVLDAVSMARGYASRTALVNEILGKWATGVRHEATLVHRVLQINPNAPEDRGAQP